MFVSVSRVRLLVSVGLAVLPVAAQADNLTISSSQTTPVVTSAASNGSSGNVTIDAAGSIAVSGTTPAVSIDSGNSVTNTGSITSSVVSNGVGVRIGGGNLAGAVLVNNATIGITGTGGSGNIGVLVAGDPVTGSITSGSAGVISVTGDNALGVSIAAPFTGDIAIRSAVVTGSNSTAISVTAPVTGNLTLLGSTSSTGASGNGLLVAAPVTGRIRLGGTVSVGSSRVVATDDTVTLGNNAVAGVRISAGVGAGVVNDSYYIDTDSAEVPTAEIDTSTDTLVTGYVISTGTAPAVWIAPDSSSPQDLTISSGASGYALVNRGQIQTTYGNIGAATTALRIGGGGATTLLSGGIGQENSGAIAASSIDGSATAIDILAGAQVPRLVNAGTIAAAATLTAATTTTVAGAGGSAYGVVVQPGGVLSTIENSGTIAVSAVGSGNGAYAILDRSGNLSSITNTGSITAAVGDSAAVRRAIDLSASSGPVIVSNSGKITGDIVFGSGDATLALSGGSITGAIVFGSGSNLLAMSGTATLAQAIAASAPLAVTLGDTARFDLSLNRAALSSITAGGNSVLVVPVLSGESALTISGSASFADSSAIELSIQSLASSQSLDILTADGGIVTEHLATLVNPAGDRFLFTSSSATITGNTLSVNLVRKSAADIGLTGAQAALFDQSLVALPDGSVEAIAIANLGDAASVAAAYRQLTPPSFGRAAMRAAQSYADTGFGAAAERLSVIGDMRERGDAGLGIWAQEIGNVSRQDAGTNETAFRNSTFGIALGADTRLGGVGGVDPTLGAALVTNWTSVRQAMGDGLPDANVSITAIGIQPYAMATWKSLFAQVNGVAAHVGYSSSRTTSIGDLASTITASWNGYQLGAGLTLGARIKAGPIRITPTNSLSWTRLHQGSYSEAGGGNFNLAVDAQTDTATTNTSKLSLAWVFPIGDGSFDIEGHGAYAYQFYKNPIVTTARFLSGGDSISLASDALSGSGKILGGGIAYRSDMMALRLRYDRRQDDGYRENAFVATLGVTF